MIGRLKGTIWEKELNGRLILNVNGVGYEVFLPLLAVGSLGEEGSELDLFIHTAVREDAITLYGFQREEERAMFRLLISVSGVGGKQAMTILGGIELWELVSAITLQDFKPLTKISGVGKKTAEMLVISLKEKVDKNPLFAAMGKGAKSKPAVPSGASQKLMDVRSALTGMGFRPAEVESALSGFQEEEIAARSFEELTRIAVKTLYKKGH